MKAIFQSFVAVALVATAVPAFANPALEDQVTYIIAGSPHTFTVKYFPHNEPNITEYVTGKAKINEVLNRVVSYGFNPRVETLEIGVAPNNMKGGSIVLTDGKLFISNDVTKAALEARLLKYFYMRYAGSYGVTYYDHNDPTAEELAQGANLVESVFRRFEANALTIELPKDLSIGIAPRSMSGGAIVVSEGRLYISITASEDSLERYFMRYVRE